MPTPAFEPSGSCDGHAGTAAVGRVRRLATRHGAAVDGSFTDFVHARLPIRAVPSMPEIRLHQGGPHSGLRRWAEQAGYTAVPYWAHAWGGGLMLARFLLDAPAWVAGRAVLDLGTGSGLVAVAACRAGAAHVVAADIDPYALAITGLNARLNGAAIETCMGDLTRGPPPHCDVILCGDLFYEARLARRVTAFFERCTAAGLLVLVGDPGRTHLPLTRLDPIHSGPAPDFGAGGVPSIGAVYRFRTTRGLATIGLPGGHCG